MPKSRLGSPFNPLQRYAFLFYAASFSDIIFEFCAYVCMYVSESCVVFICHFFKRFSLTICS